uniref:BEN domain-containing protein n=1 Tax=Bactrocera latifrons TaxID=174628 RepID=A0A0K8UA14_BACLA
MEFQQLPAISEEKFEAEVDLFERATDPDEVDKLLNRWLEMYLPALKPGNVLDQEAQEIIKIRFTYTDKMIKLARICRRIMEHQRNMSVRKVLLEQRQLTVSASNPYARHAAPSRSRSSVIALPVGSNGGQHTAPRIIYNGSYSTNNSTIKNVVINDVEAQPNSGMDGIQSIAAYETVATSSGTSLVTSSTTMQIPILTNNIHSRNSVEYNRPSSTSTSTQAMTNSMSSENNTYNIVDRNNIRHSINNEHAVQSTNTIETIGSVAAYETVATCTGSGIGISNAMDRTASSNTAALALSQPEISSTTMQMPIVHNSIRVLNSAENDRVTSTSTPIFNLPRPAASSTPMQAQNLPPTDDCNYTVLGPNGTTVSSKQFKDISFKVPSTATRSLLCLVFSEKVLAKNTLSGKPSPAFKDRQRPLKGQLDPDKVSDIIYCVRKNTNLSEKNVRTIITTKCADSTKKLRRLSQPPKATE